jgi:subtilisin family serine protease
MRKSRSWLWTNLVVVAGFGVVAAVAALGSAVATQEPSGPTGEILLANATNSVPGSYIVALKRPAVAANQVSSTAKDLSSRFGGKLGFTYTSAMRGFSVTMNADQARKLAGHPSVAYVQQNVTYRKSGTQTNPPSWGLDRIDQRDRTADKVYRYPSTAANVHAYVIDTGVRISHKEFAGRAKHGFDFVDNDADATDCDGHGTHVAGTVGGSATYSVAKEAQIVGVRVLDCEGNGTTAGVVAGINWVAQHAEKPAVANMSLGFDGGDTAVDEAVNNAISAGIPFVVAAGNENADACNSSPARLPAAITVGAISKTDARASFSNYGKCVDIFAPGQEIVSLGIKDNSATQTADGTSMASPHVAGAVALLLADNPKLTPQQVTKALLANATSGKVTGPGTGSPNKLLYTWTGPQVAGLECQPGSGAGTFTCTAKAAGSTATEITWTVDGEPLPAGDGKKTVTGECTVGRSYKVSVELADANGLSDKRSGTFSCGTTKR